MTSVLKRDREERLIGRRERGCGKTEAEIRAI